jgi:hypothetical protein
MARVKRWDAVDLEDTTNLANFVGNKLIQHHPQKKLKKKNEVPSRNPVQSMHVEVHVRNKFPTEPKDILNHG